MVLVTRPCIKTKGEPFPKIPSKARSTQCQYQGDRDQDLSQSAKQFLQYTVQPLTEQNLAMALHFHKTCMYPSLAFTL